MIDSKMVGMSWVSLKSNTFEFRSKDKFLSRS
jgi:hypothetical protein